MMRSSSSRDEERLVARQDEELSSGVTVSWERFKRTPPDKAVVSSKEGQGSSRYDLVLKSLKITAYIVAAVGVLGPSVVAKLVGVLMISQLRADEYVPYCSRNFPDEELVSHSSEAERISWIWAIYFAFLVPEILALCRGLRKLLFKGPEDPSLVEFLIPFVAETLQTIGLALLVYSVLPTMDSMKAVMLTNGVCLVPGILSMFSRPFDSKSWVYTVFIDFLAVLFQLSALFVWPLFTPQKAADNPWLLPVSLILVSCGWWENFVEQTSPLGPIRYLGKLKLRLVKTRYVTYTFVPVWKGLVWLGMMGLTSILNGHPWNHAYSQFGAIFQRHNITIQARHAVVDNISHEPLTFHEENFEMTILYTMCIQIGSACFCYLCGRQACRMLIQRFSFSFPLSVSVPVTLIVLTGLCGWRQDDVCFWDSLLPGYLFWSCPAGSFWTNFSSQHMWLWMLWIFSQLWITLHIWYPRGEALASSDVIFCTPSSPYSPFLVDSSMALNRRRDEVEIHKLLGAEGKPAVVSEGESRDGIELGERRGIISREDRIHRVYACATMWHETPEEMKGFLQSVMRMDVDQGSRKRHSKKFYKLETHVFFDDAFGRKRKNSPILLNSYVKGFIEQVEEAASQIHETGMEIISLDPPKLIATPYGGRLEWTLPKGSLLICHLKDKSRIRHKKRWSQVMYMYYLLSYRLAGIPDKRWRAVIAEHTYLLALDGDIEFQPSAVEKLVDKMKSNKELGSVCGRIHPVGGGLLAIYQTFEYAIGHWFQKSAEHVLGSVLCAPGCFSLFRAKALVDDDVLRTYTSVATEPRHFLQYDQGEDRWLCTLLLKRGWQIEYCAASDAKTHCPIGFFEFFTQRRRWIPSTIANIVDLLQDSEATVKANKDISSLYIWYQRGLLLGTLLGPGTIFLMMVGAFSLVFRLSLMTSFVWNFVPILTFILVCFVCESDAQLKLAAVLSLVYALAMIASAIAIIHQISEDSWLAPTSIFLGGVALSFIIAAVFHPLEISCLVAGLIYYVAIPSMYLLLIIYSVFNLNDVGWGTREGNKEEEGTPPQEEQGNQNNNKALQEAVSRIVSISRWLFEQLCCVRGLLQEWNERFARLEQVVVQGPPPPPPAHQQATTSRGSAEETPPEVVSPSSQSWEHATWMGDEDLAHFERERVSEEEIGFWEELITEFLKPVNPDDERQRAVEKEMKEKLLELRNYVAVNGLMINALFVAAISFLQLMKESIHIKWYWGAQTNVTFNPDIQIVEVEFHPLQLEPVGLAIVVVFGLILAIQFLAMFVHRRDTLFHILAKTKLNLWGGWRRRKEKNEEGDMAGESEDSSGSLGESEWSAATRSTALAIMY